MPLPLNIQNRLKDFFTSLFIQRNRNRNQEQKKWKKNYYNDVSFVRLNRTG